MTQHIAAVPTFDVTIPLVRRPAGGHVERMDVHLRIPSRDIGSAEKAAAEIAWVIATNMADEGANNQHGRTDAAAGANVEVVK